MKTKESIQAKRDRKLEEMRIKADYKYSILFKNAAARLNTRIEYEKEKLEKKKRSYIRKKEEEYKRKCLNEIRELKWRPKREYKSDWPKINPIEFAMEIAQENARLRDSDEDGNGRCISCGKLCSRGEHAGGHRYSRKFKNMCLEEENINLQCHKCNWITWPKWDPIEKWRVNNEYDKAIAKKFWEEANKKLARKVREFFNNTDTKSRAYNLKQKIPYLIRINKELWATKNFYTPRKKWEKIWEEYDKRH